MIFTRKDLEEKLEFKDNERKLIMKFQKELPILTVDGEGFCVDARNLHNELVVKGTEKGKGTEFAKWIKRRIDKYDFKENEDYEVFVKNDDNSKGGRPTTEYKLTLDMSKELCMVENNKKGKLARKYFILIEKALKNIIEWNQIRYPEKESYKQMCNELEKYFLRNFNKKPRCYDYGNEANALNLICLGATARDILNYFNAQDKLTREHLNKEYNMYLSKIQELNIMYLRMNLTKERRYDLIKQGFTAMYPFATFVKANKEKRIAS